METAWLNLPRIALFATVAAAASARAQAPAGLAAATLANPAFHWVPRTAPGFRVWFLRDSYPARHQDSLLGRLGPAVAHARTLIHASPLHGPLDLFFIESRAQMTALIGGRATGFAEPSTRTVILVTNPAWRAFERHEIMHVVAGQAWGRPAANIDWLVEGLAQAADGRCAGHANVDVAVALAARRGWIPLDTMLTRFRAQPDLRAYLQAAAFTGYLLDAYGPAALANFWRRGVTGRSELGKATLADVESRWRHALRQTWIPAPGELERIEANGCG